MVVRGEQAERASVIECAAVGRRPESTMTLFNKDGQEENNNGIFVTERLSRVTVMRMMMKTHCAAQ